MHLVPAVQVPEPLDPRLPPRLQERVHHMTGLKLHVVHQTIRLALEEDGLGEVLDVELRATAHLLLPGLVDQLLHHVGHQVPLKREPRGTLSVLKLADVRVERHVLDFVLGEVAVIVGLTTKTHKEKRERKNTGQGFISTEGRVFQNQSSNGRQRLNFFH